MGHDRCHAKQRAQERPAAAAPRRDPRLSRRPGLDVVGPARGIRRAPPAVCCAASAAGDPGYEVLAREPHRAPVNHERPRLVAASARLGRPGRSTRWSSPAAAVRQAARCREPDTVQWIARAGPQARRTASVCTGAFLLARAGLLDGRRVTTHWSWCGRLARALPDVHVDPDPIFIREGRIWTSAGVTAGMDLALALVEEDLDRDARARRRAPARAVPAAARRPVAVQRGRSPPGARARAAARAPGLDRRAPPASSRSRRWRAARHMSPRHFARAFRAEIGRDAGALRRARARRGRAPPARGEHEPVAAVAAPRVRQRRDDAPRLPARARVGPARVPQPLPRRRRGRSRGTDSGDVPPGNLTIEPDTQPKETEMDIAILLYDRFTALDAIGPYEVLSRLPGGEPASSQRERSRVHRQRPARPGAERDARRAERTRHRRRARRPRRGRRRARASRMLEWLRGAHETCTWTTSVCTGSLLLAAAGLLEGKRATTHWLALEPLRDLGASRRTSASSSTARSSPPPASLSGIDMALALAGTIAGDDGTGDPAAASSTTRSRRSTRARREGSARDRGAVARPQPPPGRGAGRLTRSEQARLELRETG